MYPPVNELRSSVYSSPDFGHSSAGARRISLSPSGSDDLHMSRGQTTMSTPPFHHQQATSHFLSPVQGSPSMGGASPFSSHSALSTPPGGTPPHLYMPNDLDAIDYVRPSRAPPPTQLAPVDLTTRTHRNMVRLQTAPGPMEPRISSGSVHRGPPARLSAEAVASLSSSMSSISAPATSSRPSTSSSSGASASSPRISSSHVHSSLYPLLTSGDEQYKLPPLQHKHRYRSPSPTQASSPLSRASTVSPDQEEEEQEEDEEGDLRMRSPAPSTSSFGIEGRNYSSSGSSTPSPPPVLPSIQALVGSSHPHQHHRLSPVRSGLEDKLSRIAIEPPRPLSLGEARRLALANSSSVPPEDENDEEDERRAGVPEDQRAEHARLLRDLLVSINMEYRKKFGTPPPVANARKEWEASRDVEMIGA
ncbi:hypothetical protein NLI96_g10927 [Meripilus lineatus]|uniref:Uncharacterized protein n=1 Tax=Meripilus lineatus TaxID=2056292 RepID=A0AAD5USU5_9APHY|nr:hypothetical protein NLI96_g10927 [Physisporinus lineatus]